MRKYVHETEEEKLANRKAGWDDRGRAKPTKRRPPNSIRTVLGLRPTSVAEAPVDGRKG
jgi:hypothetical protein